MILGVRHVGFVVKSMEISQRFYEGLGFEAESDPKEEFGLNISRLVGIENVQIKTLKLRLKNNKDSIWREGGFRFEIIEDDLDDIDEDERDAVAFFFNKLCCCWTLFV